MVKLAGKYSDSWDGHVIDLMSIPLLVSSLLDLLGCQGRRKDDVEELRKMRLRWRTDPKTGPTLCVSLAVETHLDISQEPFDAEIYR